MSDVVRVDPEKLRDFAQLVYSRAGMPPDDAALVADSLVQADLWDHQSHGVLRLDWYRARIVAGKMAAVTDARIAIDSRAIAMIDLNDGVCQVLAALAM